MNQVDELLANIVTDARTLARVPDLRSSPEWRDNMLRNVEALASLVRAGDLPTADPCKGRKDHG